MFHIHVSRQDEDASFWILRWWVVTSVSPSTSTLAFQLLAINASHFCKETSPLRTYGMSTIQLSTHFLVDPRTGHQRVLRAEINISLFFSRQLWWKALFYWSNMKFWACRLCSAMVWDLQRERRQEPFRIQFSHRGKPDCNPRWLGHNCKLRPEAFIILPWHLLTRTRYQARLNVRLTRLSARDSNQLFACCELLDPRFA